MTNILEPEIIPIGGFNLEYRQNHGTSQGYIYSHTGTDTAGFESTYDKLADTISFSDKEGSVDQFTKGVLGHGGTIQIASVIYPYPSAHLPSLPSRITLKAGDEIVDFLLIAKVMSLVPLYDTANPPKNPLALWQAGVIGRHTVQTLDKDGILQELVNDQGDRYMLVTEFGETQYEPNELNGLKGMPVPEGYTYESRRIKKDITIEALKVANILINGAYNFQKYDAQ